VEVHRRSTAAGVIMGEYVAHADLEISGEAVATAAVPAAADTAIDILRSGGNAFDAAVAAALVETVWLPMKCGLAGDVVALVRRSDGSFRALVSIGAGAKALDRGARPTVTGPRSVGVPGAPGGYAALAELGRLSLAELVAPAIRYARDGVRWLPIAVDLTREAESLLREWNGVEIPYLPGGQVPVSGDVLKLPGLAEVLELFALDGARLFWGELGRTLVTHVASLGGFLTVDDLKTVSTRWEAPASLSMQNGARVLATPDPTHGTRLIRALALLGQYGDDEFAAVNAAIDEERAAGLDGDGTSVVAVADRDGNAVVVVHSNSFPHYGSGLALPGSGLVLNNRPGRGFATDGPPDGPNAPAAGRVPRTTLHAWALEVGVRCMLGGTPGGVNQAPWNTQTIVNLLRRPDDLGRAVVRPRWGFDRRGRPVAEEGHRLAGLNGVRAVPALSLRSAEQVLAMAPGGWRAAADPRTGAVARSLDTRPSTGPA